MEPRVDDGLMQTRDLSNVAKGYSVSHTQRQACDDKDSFVLVVHDHKSCPAAVPAAEKGL
jgi:hypothetical protein